MNPSLRKVTQGEREKERKKQTKNVNSGHLAMSAQ